MKSGYAAYGKAHKNSLSGRALEGQAFMKAVNLLTQAKGFPENKRLLGEALRYTRQLWTIVQADLNAPNNKLDESLKANLLSLSLYVDQACLEAIENPRSNVLQGLIDVNHDVASGLLSR